MYVLLTILNRLSHKFKSNYTAQSANMEIKPVKQNQHDCVVSPWSSDLL